MDFEKLLEKYIKHVEHCEGVNFLKNSYESDVDKNFTKEEKEYLIKVTEKIKPLN